MTSYRLPDQAGANGGCAFGECEGSGWILNEAGEASSCRCRERRIRRGRMHGVASVIPPRYRGVSFDRPPVTEIDRPAVKAVRDYVESLEENLAEGKSVWLMGAVGTGKTTLAMLIAKAALEAGHSVAIYSLPKLMARIRRTYQAEPGEDDYLGFFERLTSVDLLHLDDLGAQRDTDWVTEQLYSIINQRYEDGRAVTVTSNVLPNEAAERIGARTVSRLAEMCGDFQLHIDGFDRRIEHAGGLGLEQPGVDDTPPPGLGSDAWAA